MNKFEFPEPQCDNCGRMIDMGQTPIWHVQYNAMFCSFKCVTDYQKKHTKRAKISSPDEPPAAQKVGMAG